MLLKGGRSAQYIKYKFFIFYNLIQQHSDKKTQPNITSEHDIFSILHKADVSYKAKKITVKCKEYTSKRQNRR